MIEEVNETTVKKSLDAMMQEEAPDYQDVLAQWHKNEFKLIFMNWSVNLSELKLLMLDANDSKRIKSQPLT